MQLGESAVVVQRRGVGAGVVLGVRLTGEEADRFGHIAESRGMTLSELGRDLILQAIASTPDQRAPTTEP